MKEIVEQIYLNKYAPDNTGQVNCQDQLFSGSNTGEKRYSTLFGVDHQSPIHYSFSKFNPVTETMEYIDEETYSSELTQFFSQQ